MSFGDGVSPAMLADPPFLFCAVSHSVSPAALHDKCRNPVRYSTVSMCPLAYVYIILFLSLLLFHFQIFLDIY